MPVSKPQARVAPQVITILSAAFLIFVSYYVGHWQWKDVNVTPKNSMSGLSDGKRFIQVGSVTKLPTLAAGDRVLVTNPKSGAEFVARVIAMPGQKIRQQTRRIFIDDREENRELATPQMQAQAAHDFEDLIVPLDCVYVLVEDRSRLGAQDSRVCGPVPHHLIIGKVIW